MLLIETGQMLVTCFQMRDLIFECRSPISVRLRRTTAHCSLRVTTKLLCATVSSQSPQLRSCLQTILGERMQCIIHCACKCISSMLFHAKSSMPVLTQDHVLSCYLVDHCFVAVYILETAW